MANWALGRGIIEKTALIKDITTTSGWTLPFNAGLGRRTESPYLASLDREQGLIKLEVDMLLRLRKEPRTWIILYCAIDEFNFVRDGLYNMLG